MKVTFLNAVIGMGTINAIMRKELADKGRKVVEVNLSMCDTSDFYMSGTEDFVRYTKANAQPTVIIFTDYNRALPGVQTIMDRLVDGTITPFNEDVEVFIINYTTDATLNDLVRAEVQSNLLANNASRHNLDKRLTKALANIGNAIATAKR